MRNPMCVSFVWLVAVAGGGVGGAVADVSPHAGMMRWPDISKTQICFVYANDIWVAPKGGGAAAPIASPPGLESFPRFNADGSVIAFVGNYDGNRDLYTIPVAGGVPTRVTHHPAGETLADWVGRDRLLYITNGFSGLARQSQLWTTSSAGGLPTKLPVPYGGFGSISADGEWLAYTLHSTDTRTWKRYRGGMATDVWLFNLTTRNSKRITTWEGTDTLPMWVPGGDDKAVYYISDEGPEHRLNIWRHDVVLGKSEQVTTYKDDDVRWPSIGPGDEGKGEIIFQLGAELRVLDLDSRKDRVVTITIPGDRPTMKPRAVDAGKNLESAGLSPSAKRVVLEARGDVWTVPGKEGVARNLTRTDGVYERTPTYSPDGKWIAYVSDATGENEVYLRVSDAKPAEEKKDDKKDEKKDAKEPEKPAPSEALPVDAKQLTNFGPGFRRVSSWSPDSKWIVVIDHAGKIMLVSPDGPTTETKTIDTDPTTQVNSVAFSHDSAWIAYDIGDPENQNHCVWLYEMATGVKTRVTSPMFNSANPAFDRKGEFLYFISNRAIDRPMYSDIDNSFAYVDSGRLYAIPLRADVKSPLSPKADEESFKVEKPKEEKKEEKPAEEKKDEAKKDDKKDDEKKPEKKEDKKPIVIETANMEARAIQLPIRAGNLWGTSVSDSGKLIYVRADAVRDDEAPPGGSLKIFDLSADEKKEETILDGTGGFEMSPDGKKLLAFKDGGVVILDPSAGAKPQKVNTSGLTATINPRNEWKQIVADTWRLQRDFFYEPTMHGVDWKKIGDHYKGMVDDAATREDIAWIQAEMISELNIGHAYVTNPGDVEQPPQVSVGMLGCDYEFDAAAKAYKIARVITGGAWDADARGPLSQPGVNVKPGDYLLAVNGTPVDATRDPWASFQGLAGKTVTITVSGKPGLDGEARDYVVKPIANETNLRYRAFIEAKRVYVEEKSQGQIGYIYVPNTGVDGQNDLFRQFYGQRQKAALIIDERWNGGGQIPTRFIELLNRPVTNYWARRHGADWTWPPDSAQGHMCMLVNGLAGSGGDMFPWLFKFNKLGPVIGTRTWGGLVGISGNPGLIDGGGITVPTFGFYEKDGTWGVEGHGTDPDIEVIDDPMLMADAASPVVTAHAATADGPAKVMYSPFILPGGDPQLERAIIEMQKAIKERPYVKPARPQSPNRSGMGLDPRDK